MKILNLKTLTLLLFLGCMVTVAKAQHPYVNNLSAEPVYSESGEMESVNIVFTIDNLENISQLEVYMAYDSLSPFVVTEYMITARDTDGYILFYNNARNPVSNGDQVIYNYTIPAEAERDITYYSIKVLLNDRSYSEDVTTTF